MRRRGYKYWKVYLGGKTKLTNNAKINTFLRQAVTWHVQRQEEVTGEGQEQLGRHRVLGCMKELNFLFGLGHLPSVGKITAGERQQSVCPALAWFTSLGSKGACEIPCSACICQGPGWFLPAHLNLILSLRFISLVLQWHSASPEQLRVYWELVHITER